MGRKDMKWIDFKRHVKVKKVKSSLCLTKYTLRHEDEWGSGCAVLRFLGLK
jgi:hypothetical protein